MKKNKFLIIGLSEFGNHVAKYLTELKNEICIVDVDSEKVNAYKDVYENVLRCDCLQDQTLKELGIKDYEAVIVTVGDNFQNSLEITSKLKEFGAKYVVAKSYSEIQSKFLTMAGADQVIYPEKESAIKLATTISNTKLIDFTRISKDLGVYQIKVPKSWIGKALVDLDIRKKYGINILAVCKEGQVFIPVPTYTFESGDSVYTFSNEKAVQKMI